MSDSSKKPVAGHGPKGMGAIEKPKNFKATFKKFLKELKPIRIPIIMTFIFLSISVVIAVYIPKLLGNTLTEVAKYINPANPSPSISKILTLIIIMASLYLVNYVLGLISQILMGKASAKVTYNLRKRLKHKLTRLPLNYYDNRQTGDILSVFVNDVDNIGQSLQQSLQQVINSVLTVIGVFVMMLTINFWLTLIVIVLLPISMLFTGFVMKHSQKYFTRQASDLGDVNSHIEETYTNQKTVKSYTNEDKAIETFDAKNAKLYESSQKSQFYSGLLMPIIMFTNNIGYVILSLVSCIFILKGMPHGGVGFSPFSFMLEFGYLITFLNYSQQFTQPITNIAQLMNVFQTTLAASERVFEILEAEEEVVYEVKNTLGKVYGDIKFDHLRFGYTPDKILLKDVNVDINSGQMVAIVGPTGAGKTTIVNLIMRFYELNSGAITIDGINIQSVTRSNLRERIGMVLQDTWLFSGTILDNLKYGNEKATIEEVNAVCEAVHASHFINTLSDGYNTVINENVTNISQGQKQLLTIARAIIAKPDIMILDEATSSIDTRTEVLIQKAMKVAMENRTSFVIAHRLSTIISADKILVVNDGDIVEQGTHNELMANKGFYYNLYNSQFS